MRTEGDLAEQPVDLIAVVLHRSGLDPRCNLMVRTATHTLTGVPPLKVDALAEFAFAEVCRQDAHETERRRVIMQMYGQAIEIDAERDRRLAALNGAPYQSPLAGQHLNMHRAGTLLAAGLSALKKNRPANAKDSQLFAALGLLLMNNGLQRTHGEIRETLLLDAAECIYAWHSLKDEVKLREPWKLDLYAMLPELVDEFGSELAAKPAVRRFIERYPSHAGKVKNLGTFGKTISILRGLRRG